ncbi:hypothetical protein EsH8_V_000693 [Colletotrichum jinshuiense]
MRLALLIAATSGLAAMAAAAAAPQPSEEQLFYDDISALNDDIAAVEADLAAVDADLSALEGVPAFFGAMLEALYLKDQDDETLLRDFEYELEEIAAAEAFEEDAEEVAADVAARSLDRRGEEEKTKGETKAEKEDEKKAGKKFGKKDGKKKKGKKQDKKADKAAKKDEVKQKLFAAAVERAIAAWKAACAKAEQAGGKCKRPDNAALIAQCAGDVSGDRVEVLDATESRLTMAGLPRSCCDLMQEWRDIEGHGAEARVVGDGVVEFSI